MEVLLVISIGCIVNVNRQKVASIVPNMQNGFLIKLGSHVRETSQKLVNVSLSKLTCTNLITILFFASMHTSYLSMLCESVRMVFKVARCSKMVSVLRFNRRSKEQHFKDDFSNYFLCFWWVLCFAATNSIVVNLTYKNNFQSALWLVKVLGISAPNTNMN